MRIGSSTFILLVTILVVADLLFSFVPESRPDDLTRSRSPVSKIIKILHTKENADVLLSGSSLAVLSSIRADDKLRYGASRFDLPYHHYAVINYCHSVFLEKMLSEQLGTKLQVCNAGICGGVLSDQLIVAQRYLQAGKTPKLAIVCVAPREFMIRGLLPEKTIPYEVLSENQTDPKRIFQHKLSWLSNIFRRREDSKDRLVTFVSETTKRPLASEDAGWPIMWKQPPNGLYDIPQYRKMYLPVDYKQLHQQEESYKQLLALLKAHNVPTVVVDVPLTSEHYKIFPTSVLNEYESLLSVAASDYGATVVRSRDFRTYNDRLDFEDGTHLNLDGATKFYKDLAAVIAKDPSIASALTKSPAALAQRSAAVQ